MDEVKKQHWKELLDIIKARIKTGESLEHDGNLWVVADHAQHEPFKDFSGDEDDLLLFLLGESNRTKFYFDNKLPESDHDDTDLDLYDDGEFEDKQ